MNLKPRKRWGFVLLLAGLALMAWGGRQFLTPPQYRAAALVKVGATVPDAIGNEFEVIRSEPVLGPAIAGLGLEREWGERFNGGKPVSTEETRQLILRRLSLRQVRGASVIEIGVTSLRPDETDRIANAIAGAYRNYRRAQRERVVSEYVSETVKPLEEKLNEDIHQITEVQRQLHELNVEGETNDASTVTGKLDTYVELKQQLEQQLAQLQRSQIVLQEKIGKERLKQSTGLSVVEVINPAAPPQQPISTPRALGIGLLCSGASLSVGGGWLLRKPRPPKPPRPGPLIRPAR